jgi:glucose/arabinose dehydrogenase
MRFVVLLISLFGLSVMVWLTPAGAGRSAQAGPLLQADADEGRALFQQKCIGCHAIQAQGIAGGETGPDLSDFAQRRQIAGVLTNTPVNLGLWLANPQRYKPGIDMPALGLGGDEITALVRFLRQPAPTASAPTPATPAPPLLATATDLTIRLEPAYRGLNRPLLLTHAGDGSGNVYIVERAGRIRVGKDGELRRQPFLDITRRVSRLRGERGLLSLAFHPEFAQNGYLFVTYTDRRGDSVISRFTALPDRSAADPSSEKVILRIKQPYDTHNVDHIAFGPDGMLWIGAGDGGSRGDPRGNGQNLGTLLGKLLRIDVDRGDPYAIPPDNPFVGVSNARGEIWALGVRNPWRFAFDRETDALYFGDVGQDTWEEINVVPLSRGGYNFGWNRMEGARCFPPDAVCDASGLTWPVAEYSQETDGCSVIGGYVYRGRRFPSLSGVYFFADYCEGTIWRLDRDVNGAWQHRVVYLSDSAFAGFSSFGQDEAGELYVTALGEGVVYRIMTP